MNLKSLLQTALEQSKKFFSKKLNIVKAGGFAALFATSAYYSSNPQAMASMIGLSKTAESTALSSKIKNTRYGFDLDTFQIKQAKIGANESLGNFLEQEGLNASKIDKINKNCDGIFNVRTFRTGREYTILRSKQPDGASYFCYSPDAYSHLLINLKTLEAQKVQLPVETRIEVSSGIVESNLWNTMEDNGWSLDMIDKLEDALKCSVDFHHINTGDKFKLIYEQHYVDGKAAGTGKLLAGYFTNGTKEYNAIFYEDGAKIKGFFDEEGRPLKKTFLKSPIKFAHISSGFNLKRFHPVLKYVKPHLGTDFAAAQGTPIMAVADGVVEEATRRGGNGNFVKLRHDGTYETQYLHMCRHAAGMRPGVRVSQGQVIGYVGQTGLATGPHVCFRFWKHGEQINFLKANLPFPQPMDKAALPAYLKFKDGVIGQLASIQYRSANEVAAVNNRKGIVVKP